LKAESERTEIIQGEQQVRDAILGLFVRARTRLDISAASITEAQPGGTDDLARSLVALKDRGVKARLITEISKRDLDAAHMAVQIMEVRHLKGLKATFAVNDDEYLSLPVTGEGRQSLPLIYSSAGRLVEQHQFIFDRLWNSGEPAGQRIQALESGSDLPEIEVIRDSSRIREVYLSAVKGAKSRVLLLLPTPSTYYRDEKIGVIDSLLEAARRGVDVKLLAPIEQQMLSKLGGLTPARQGGSLEFRSIPTADTQETVTILVVDNHFALTIDEKDGSKLNFDEGVGMATLVTQEARTRANIRFFQRSWMESELREAEKSARIREENSRRRAELMQDILTHDIRNFNQVTRLNAELLGEEVSDRESKKRVSAILKSVDGSSRLIERTKKLGSILSASTVTLRPVGLRGSLSRSLSLVNKGNPEKVLILESRIKGKVLADAFLDEIFTNLLSNSVKYTEGQNVKIMVQQEGVKLMRNGSGAPLDYWKISISDWGRGIPDSMKPNVFSRYLETAKGSGLGMSIVHALATERYGGKVAVRDRVEGDPSRGTTVEIWLLKA
jgi:signal transduction histidine kinase